jgi:hypothetical protein
MYKAKFEFTSKEPKALNFQPGDQFTVMEFVDKHWCLAQNGYGQVGFIPNDYIEKDEVGRLPCEKCPWHNSIQFNFIHSIAPYRTVQIYYNRRL